MPARRTIDDQLEAARGRLDRLAPTAALRAQVDDGALLIDTRATDLREKTGQIPGSLHIPLSVLYWRLDSTSGYDDPRVSDPTTRIVIVCAHGYSSSLAAATLLDLGFSRATDVVGGFRAWAAAGLPVEPAVTWRPDRLGPAGRRVRTGAIPDGCGGVEWDLEFPVAAAAAEPALGAVS